VTAHGASHKDRSIESQGIAELQQKIDKKPFGQSIFFLPPFNRLWREGLAMIRKIHSHHPILGGDLFIIHEVAPLPAVRARSVLAKKRNPFSRFFKIDPIFYAMNRDIAILPGDSLEFQHLSPLLIV
jgi:hypothetical protein